MVYKQKTVKENHCQEDNLYDIKRTSVISIIFFPSILKVFIGSRKIRYIVIIHVQATKDVSEILTLTNRKIHIDVSMTLGPGHEQLCI